MRSRLAPILPIFTRVWIINWATRVWLIDWVLLELVAYWGKFLFLPWVQFSSAYYFSSVSMQLFRCLFLFFFFLHHPIFSVASLWLLLSGANFWIKITANYGLSFNSWWQMKWQKLYVIPQTLTVCLDAVFWRRKWLWERISNSRKISFVVW